MLSSSHHKTKQQSGTVRSYRDDSARIFSKNLLRALRGSVPEWMNYLIGSWEINSLNRISGKKPKKILVIGGSDGCLTEGVNNTFCTYAGIDTAEDFPESKKKYPVVADLKALPFKKYCFDIVSAPHSLMRLTRIKDQKKAAEEMMSVSSNSIHIIENDRFGRWIAAVFGLGLITQKILRLAGKRKKEPPVYHFKTGEIERLFEPSFRMKNKTGIGLFTVLIPCLVLLNLFIPEKNIRRISGIIVKMDIFSSLSIIHSYHFILKRK